MRARSTWLQWLTLAVLGLFAATYLVVATTRIIYPFDLDFIEDDVLVEAWRFAQGLPVFVAPNADFVPHAYAPLYMLLSAGLFKLDGVGFRSMRALSFAATLATGFMLYWAGQRVSHQRATALLAPGLFLAGYSLTGAEYELARVDALFVMFVVVGTLVGIVGSMSRRSVAFSALCLALAFFTKQTGLIFGVGMAGYLLSTQRKQAGLFCVVFALAVLLPLGVMDRATGGWSTTYLFAVPANDPIVASRITDFVRSDLLRHLGPLCVLWLATLIVSWRMPAHTNPLTRAWLWFALLALLDSGWMRARLGGNANSLMPAYTFLCLLPVLALRELPLTFADRALGRIVCGGVYLAVLAQCALGVYNPLADVPSTAMQQSGQRLIQRIAQMPGPVLVLEHPYYALLAGKPPGVSLTALWHARGRGAEPLPADLIQRIHDQYYAAIIGDDGEYAEVEAEVDALIAATYTNTMRLNDGDAPPTLSGVIVRPAVVFTRKN
ncbi:MAG: glycosyltransferase family 39 protein [Chloroflexota bacterium]